MMHARTRSSSRRRLAVTARRSPCSSDGMSELERSSGRSCSEIPMRPRMWCRMRLLSFMRERPVSTATASSVRGSFRSSGDWRRIGERVSCGALACSDSGGTPPTRRRSRRSTVRCSRSLTPRKPNKPWPSCRRCSAHALNSSLFEISQSMRWLRCTGSASRRCDSISSGHARLCADVWMPNKVWHERRCSPVDTTDINDWHR